MNKIKLSFCITLLIMKNLFRQLLEVKLLDKDIEIVDWRQQLKQQNRNHYKRI